VTVGLCGAVGATGGSSTFAGQTGAGGTGGSATVSGASMGVAGPGVGGAASGGDINIAGGYGEFGIRCIHGSATTGWGGGGGGSMLVPFFPGVPTGAIANGVAGKYPGGGSRGAVSGNANGAVNGAVGGDGFVRVREYTTDWSATAAIVASMRRTVVTTSGNYDKPDGLKFINVTVIGGGGGSADTPVAAAGNCSAGGGGGGAGASIKLYAASDLAASTPYVVGAQGVKLAGGSSTFLGQTGGGGGGATSSAAGTTPAGTGVGTGGTASGGDINVPGGYGESGVRAAHGLATWVQVAAGGASLYATATPQRQTTSNMGGYTCNYPGGGGGGSASVAGAAQGGTAGGVGWVIFEEYF
jgi:hypothetical protein